MNLIFAMVTEHTPFLFRPNFHWRNLAAQVRRTKARLYDLICHSTCLSWVKKRTAVNSKASINHSSLSFWIGEDVIRDWKQDKQNKRERTHRFSDRPIATVLTIKRLFSMPLLTLQGMINSILELHMLRGFVS
ncbi:transposase [Vibrio injensis]|uniref:transposase n=1 Tax=Vibrio injensis TaxID=1307414 RepID=UPI00093294E3|nr:transposase [Vibrio injensis]